MKTLDEDITYQNDTISIILCITLIELLQQILMYEF